MTRIIWGAIITMMLIFGGLALATGDLRNNGPRLEHLFSVELQYRGPIELAPFGEKDGRLVGGGDGTVEGAKVKGTLRWSNFERTHEDGVCTLQIPAVIETHDGAQIRFEARGHALQPDKARPHRWSETAALRFHTEDSRYQWLNTILAVWEGEFDMKAGRARARVYARANDFAEETLEAP
jgi:hypothetical protein